MRSILGLSYIIGISAIFAVASWLWSGQAEPSLAAGEITMADPRLKENKIVWVDSRSRSDYEREHASGAILLNKEEWDKLLAGLFDAWSPGQSIVVYCTPDCHSSSEIAERIRELGIEPVFFLHGGYEALKRATN